MNCAELATSVHMVAPELFYTADEVAAMFRSTPPALASQRTRGIEPGSLAVKVGGKYLYPRSLIDGYLDDLSPRTHTEFDLNESTTRELFRMPPTNVRMLDVDEASERLGVEVSVLESQWERSVYPGALGWRVTPNEGLVFAPREVDIWIEAHAHHDVQNAATDPTV